VDILAVIKAWIDRHERRPDSPPVQPVRRFTCRGCHERAEWPGYVVKLLVGELRYCSETCAPPFLREGFEMPNLYGDPR
jgi:hypothetical protein